jgi:hypothetical protein
MDISHFHLLLTTMKLPFFFDKYTTMKLLSMVDNVIQDNDVHVHVLATILRVQIQLCK